MINNNISKDLIKELRRRTSISLIKCKQALIESNGNIELAIENLRKLGLKTDTSRSRRPTLSGIIAVDITSNHKKGLILEITCETDFVSKNVMFQEFTNIVMITALNESIDNIDCLRSRVEKQRLILIEKIGENIQINRFLALSGNFLSSYIHRSKIGVIVSTSGDINNKNIIKYIAMHIAAKNPKYIYSSDVPENIISQERSIQMSIAKKSVKSSKILEKIITGRIEKFMCDIVLTKQEFILDTGKTVAHILNEYRIKIDAFIRLEIGEYS